MIEEAELKSMLSAGRWWRYERPFHHVVARNVFTPSAYKAIADDFERVLAEEFAKDPQRFTRVLPPEEETFAVFRSRAWHDLVERIMGVKATGDVEGGLHHHEPESDGGWPHNDLNPGWFVGEADRQRVNISRPDLCNYYTGEVSRPDLAARPTVRAVAVVFYVANPSWRPGDGGETGLYEMASDPLDDPVVRIPPVNNSMVMFNCTPFSYHGFVGRNRKSRNSVIMWLHRPYEEAVARWGKEALVPWTTPPIRGFVY